MATSRFKLTLCDIYIYIYIYMGPIYTYIKYQRPSQKMMTLINIHVAR